jgi:hypothetical protein
MYPSNPRDEQRHYPIILHGLKHIGWWRLRKTSSMKMVVMKLGNTPRLAAWNPPLASFPPPVLILATSSSNSLPHLAAVSLWWMGTGRMIGCSSHQRQELLIDRGAPRSKGIMNQGKKGLGWSDEAGRPGAFMARFGPIFLLTAHLDILDLNPFICAILRSSPRSR